MSSKRFNAYTILAAVDYSDTSSRVVREALDLARLEHAVALHVLHTYYDPRAGSWATQRMMP
jgi:hypothetical protein